MSEETKNVGGPAFPLDLTVDGERRWGYGMTLRDYFAAQAMQALIDNDGLSSEIPTQAYDIADAMIEARKAWA